MASSLLCVDWVHRVDSSVRVLIYALYASRLLSSTRIPLSYYTYTHNHTHTQRNQKKYDTNAPLVIPVGSNFNFIKFLSYGGADIHQAGRASFIRYSIRLLTRTATLIRGFPKGAN